MVLPISVILCSYNGSRFIAEQVTSILQQSYPVTELIILDDASTDDTISIVEEIARLDHRILIISNQQNIGYTANFEKAMQIAKYDLIAISDQDDIWHERKLEILVSKLMPDTTLIYCDSVRFQNWVPNHPVANKKNRKIEGQDPKKIAMFNTISGHAMVIRRSLLDVALPIPNNVYYDWWLAVVAMCNGGVQFVPDILVYQRAHENNVTIQKGLSEKALRDQYRTMLDAHLLNFKEIAHLSNNNKIFFNTFYELWHTSLQKKWNPALFIFLLKNRQVLYYYKIRKLAIWSQCKHSFLFSFRF